MEYARPDALVSTDWLAARLDAPDIRVVDGSFYLPAAKRDPKAEFANQHIPGAGYYHAPFRGFFSFPYNHYDVNRKQYFYGGHWGPAPHRSIVNISAPTPEAAKAAESVRTDLLSSYVPRSGFGRTSNSHFTRS